MFKIYTKKEKKQQQQQQEFPKNWKWKIENCWQIFLGLQQQNMFRPSCWFIHLHKATKWKEVGLFKEGKKSQEEKDAIRNLKAETDGVSLCVYPQSPLARLLHAWVCTSKVEMKCTATAPPALRWARLSLPSTNMRNASLGCNCPMIQQKSCHVGSLRPSLQILQ